MPAVSFHPANLVDDYEAIASINVEYVSWVHAEMERAFGVSADEVMGMPVTDYVASIPKLCGQRPPIGVFYLIKVDGELAGMCALRSAGSGMAEIKRVYVRPPCRGMKLGQLALQRLMSDAASFGYRSLRLDTAPFMSAAHHLYESHGFVDCSPYEGTEVPAVFHSRWRFMQRATS